MATTTSDAQLTTRERSLRVRLMPYIDRFGILLLVLLMIVIGTITQPEVFLTWRNLSNLPGQNAANAVLAIGMFVVILTAGIDLSVGSVLALAMMTTAVLARDGFPPLLLVPLPILIGMTVGFVNGFGLTKMRLPHPFIVTLGTLNIARGLGNLVSGGVPVSGLPEVVRFWGAGNIALGNVQLPVSLIVVAALYVSFFVFLQYTRTGRHIYAIGGNSQAARVSGINVDRTLMLVYILCGAMAGLAGLLVAGRTNSGFPNAGIGAELDAISAVIIGGASFFGGRGSVLGVLAGVLVIGLLRNILNLNNVPVFWQQVLIGVVIIFAVFLDVLRRRAGSANE
ncbi:MAG: sugar ABC transporter permease [Candidatus Roseilinea sp.]|nr:MAG: sugar ABC transporter permease [Candidatus Roseilinea sp.]